MKIYSFSSYLPIINQAISDNREIKGYRGKLAAAAQTHASYFSKVLNQEVHLTPDQAAGLCAYWGYSEPETDYFLNLVNFERASSPTLKRILKTKIDRALQQNEQLSSHLSANKIQVTDENTLYYSAWYYSAVHVLLTIPGFRSSCSISEKLRIPESLAASVLLKLTEWGLAEKQGPEWRVLQKNVHLSNDSWISTIHHINWRCKSVENFQLRDAESLIYSGLHTVSKKDYQRIRKFLLDSLVKVDEIVRPSKEEELCVLALDWYRI